MTVLALRKQLKDEWDRLRGEERRAVAKYIRTLSEPDGTRFKPSFMRRIKRSLKDIKNGNGTEWSKLKKRIPL